MLAHAAREDERVEAAEGGRHRRDRRPEAMDVDVDRQPGVVVVAREDGAHVGVAGQAADAALAVEPLFEGVGVDPVTQQPQHEPGIDAARARGHDEALHRREAHRRVDADAVAHGGQRRAGAEMAAHDPRGAAARREA